MNQDQRTFKTASGRSNDKAALPNDVARAFSEIANTKQGKVIKAWAQATLESFVIDDADDRAWIRHEALRKISREIVEMMETSPDDDRKRQQ